MNEKYSLKIIQHGKTQQVRTVQNGAGMAGQAVVIQATDAARYQLVNVVTLVSPSKLQALEENRLADLPDAMFARALTLAVCLVMVVGVVERREGEA